MILPILNVKNVDESIAYYLKLGFKLDMAMPGPDGVNAFAFVSINPETTIGLNRSEDQFGAIGAQFMVYVAEETNLEELFQSVQANGISVESEIKLQYWGDQTFSVKDPDGYLITLSKTVHQADMDHVAAVMRGDAEA